MRTSAAGGSAVMSDRDNGITAARVGLALIVIVSHSFALSGHGPDPLVVESGGQLSLGFAAVLGFFGLSGWLLAGSRQRNDRGRFLGNRVRRIYPAYLASLLFAASVGIVIGGGQLADAARYVVGSLAIVSSPGMPSAFGGATVNGSLWTLGPEVLCYGVLAIVPVRLLRPFALGVLILFLALWPAMPGAETLLFLAFATGAGARVFGLPTSVPVTGGAFIAAVALFGAHLTPLGGVALSFAALGLANLPLRFSWDLSYGTYVYAYPIQKALAIADPLVLAAATIAVVLPMAAASWRLLEAPALGLRNQADGPDQVCHAGTSPFSRSTDVVSL